MQVLTVEGLAAAALVSTLVFAAALLSLHVLSPEFDPSVRYVSEYALGRFGIVMQAAFVVLGLALLLLAAAAARDPSAAVAVRLVPVALLVAAAVCVIGLAVYSSDPSTGGAATREGEIHNELANVGFWLLVAGMLAWSALRAMVAPGGWSWLALLLATFALGALAFLRYVAWDGDAPGSAQRLFIASTVSWLLVASSAMGLAAAGRD